MNRFTRLLGAALLVAPLFGSVTLAADAPAKPAAKAKAPTLKGAYAQMPTELGLTEDQKAKILASVTARDAEIKTWTDANKAKMDELTTKIAAARAGGDSATVKSLTTELSKIKQGSAAINDKYDAEIDNALTPEQRDKWAGYKSYVGNVGTFKSLNLTEEQKGQIKDRYIKAGAQLRAAANPKDRTALGVKIRELAEAEVLTAEQRTALANEREAMKKAKEAPKAAKPG